MEHLHLSSPPGDGAGGDHHHGDDHDGNHDHDHDHDGDHHHDGDHNHDHDGDDLSSQPVSVSFCSQSYYGSGEPCDHEADVEDLGGMLFPLSLSSQTKPCVCEFWGPLFECFHPNYRDNPSGF